jgi:hypothetical protein
MIPEIRIQFLGSNYLNPTYFIPFAQASLYFAVDHGFYQNSALFSLQKGLLKCSITCSGPN